jgi:hypothetical protein
LGPAAAGAATLFPASEEHPLNECRHFLVAAPIEADVAGEGPDIVSFYTRLGVVVLGIVMDGDCGVDAMCGMLQRPQTHDARVNIREELHDYLIERIREPWMQDVMRACQEISTSELEAHRSCGTLSSGHAVTTLAIPNVETEVVCSQVHENVPIHYSDELLDALAWSIGVKDRGIIVSLACELHEVVRDEQIR